MQGNPILNNARPSMGVQGPPAHLMHRKPLRRNNTYNTQPPTRRRVYRQRTQHAVHPRGAVAQTRSRVKNQSASRTLSSHRTLPSSRALPSPRARMTQVPGRQNPNRVYAPARRNQYVDSPQGRYRASRRPRPPSDFYDFNDYDRNAYEYIQPHTPVRRAARGDHQPVRGYQTRTTERVPGRKVRNANNAAYYEQHGAQQRPTIPTRGVYSRAPSQDPRQSSEYETPQRSSNTSSRRTKWPSSRSTKGRKNVQTVQSVGPKGYDDKSTMKSVDGMALEKGTKRQKFTHKEILEKSLEEPVKFVVVLGEDAPWWVYVAMHTQKTKRFKCKTHVGRSKNPFRKEMFHNLKALKRCKVTRPAAGYWMLSMVVGPFDTQKKACSVVKDWRASKRAAYGRHAYGMKLCRDSKGELLCFSNLLTEDVPIERLEKVPPEFLTPFKSTPLGIEEVETLVKARASGKKALSKRDTKYLNKRKHWHE